MATTKEKMIIDTLAYFSIFNYPLTVIELWLNLYSQDLRKLDFNEFLNVVEKLKSDNIILEKQSYLLFLGNEGSIKKRQDNYRDSFAKYELTKKIVRLFSLIPFIKAIYVCNSLAYNNSCQQGDIDLFIIVKSKRLWLTRFLILSFLKLLNLRPLTNNKQNKIDPTFFCDEDKLCLKDVSLENDIYLTYWLAQLAPIYDPENVLIKIRQLNNFLLEKLPNNLPISPHPQRQIGKNWLTVVFQKLASIILNYNFLERFTKNIQIKIMPAILKEQLNKNKGVVANDEIIKMHSNDRRLEYCKQWEEISNRHLTGENNEVVL